MQVPDKAAVRALFEEFCLRKGHGVVSETAQRTGLSRGTVSDFRHKGRGSDSIVLAIAEYLARHDYYVDGQAESAKEEPVAYVTRQPKDLFEEAADDCFQMGKILLSTHRSEKEKRERFAAFIRGYHDGLLRSIQMKKNGE